MAGIVDSSSIAGFEFASDAEVPQLELWGMAGTEGTLSFGFTSYLVVAATYLSASV